MDIQYLIRLEEKMQNELLRLCTERGVLKGVLLATEDIDQRFHFTRSRYRKATEVSGWWKDSSQPTYRMGKHWLGAWYHPRKRNGRHDMGYSC